MPDSGAVRNDARPDPDAILARVRAEQREQRRGRLKLFFGASAGVGKTYAMLQEARERQTAGTDVVVGIVETHRRAETEALLTGLTALPPRMVDYRGIRLREFDLDAALARKPELILVDELAHTNAEGSRHAKRWQDVMELLDAGIDVYTTVNVQHVESLNDVVAQITGIIVRETIPDSIIERADEIELIDIPPDDLLARLKEGKVYIPQQAQQAADKFFRKEILVALRELALRQTADRVNLQVQVERAGQAIQRTWATNERLLVCVGPSPLSARVVRVARRMAAALHAEWIAVSVETPRLSGKADERIRRHLRLAERLGAESLILTGERVAEEIIAFARKRNVTKIIIGKPAVSRWRELLFGSVVDDLIRRSGDMDVHVVKGEADEVKRPPRPRRPRRRLQWKSYAYTLAIVSGTTLVALAVHPIFTDVNLTMVLLAGVVLAAIRFGIGPSIFASVVSVLAFDFFFTEPLYTIFDFDRSLTFTFVVFLAVAVLISTLTERINRQAEAVRTRYQRTAALYFMSRQLAATADRDTMIRLATRHISDVFAGEAVLLLPDRDGHVEPFEPRAFPTQSPNELAAAQWVFSNQKWAGRGTDTLPAAQALYVPLIAGGRPLGVLGLRPRQPDDALEPDQRHMLETFGTQLAIALQRTQFAEQAQRAAAQAENEQIRSSLLSCVSHDLRTPLAAISGAAGSLLEDRGALTDDGRRELLRLIGDESARLNHLVGKLLEMTRLESAGITLAREWYPLDELVGAALLRLESQLGDRSVQVDLPPDLPLVYVDGLLLEEVFTNLLENAALYTPPGTHVRVVAHSQPRDVLVEVLDDGPGLQTGTEEEVFRKFYRDRPESDRSGTGLGLSICRAIVALHGGQIGAENQPAGGARFWFTLPLAELPPRAADALAGGAQAATL